MAEKTVTMYIGMWCDKELAYSLHEGHVKSLVESHYAFGDPSEDEYALGNNWATTGSEIGWRIVARTVSMLEIDVTLDLSGEVSLPHVHWQCPYCRKRYSDAWLPDDTLPVLLGCGCEEASKHRLGTASPSPG